MSISLYGGLILFSLFLLFDTQFVVKRAQMHPISGTSEERMYKPGYYGSLGEGYYDVVAPKMRRFDPINAYVEKNIKLLCSLHYNYIILEVMDYRTFALLVLVR